MHARVRDVARSVGRFPTDLIAAKPRPIVCGHRGQPDQSGTSVSRWSDPRAPLVCGIRAHPATARRRGRGTRSSAGALGTSVSPPQRTQRAAEPGFRGLCGPLRSRRRTDHDAGARYRCLAHRGAVCPMEPDLRYSIVLRPPCRNSLRSVRPTSLAGGTCYASRLAYSRDFCRGQCLRSLAGATGTRRSLWGRCVSHSQSRCCPW